MRIALAMLAVAAVSFAAGYEIARQTERRKRFVAPVGGFRNFGHRYLALSSASMARMPAGIRGFSCTACSRSAIAAARRPRTTRSMRSSRRSPRGSRRQPPLRPLR